MSMFWRLEQHALLVKAGADLPVAILDPSHGQHAGLAVLEEHTHSSCSLVYAMCACAVRVTVRSLHTQRQRRSSTRRPPAAAPAILILVRDAGCGTSTTCSRGVQTTNVSCLKNSNSSKNYQLELTVFLLVI